LEFVEAVSNIILYHHERVDGGGYPMGLTGSEIPVGARVLAVIDAYQSMTLGRPYKHSKTVELASLELVECADHQFDRNVVEAFLEVLRDEGKLNAGQVQGLVRRIGGTVPSRT
jgi:HD-GYP domain-containing protein (c-di-GMP phosphodiesterase class II)